MARLIFSLKQHSFLKLLLTKLDDSGVIPPPPLQLIPNIVIYSKKKKKIFPFYELNIKKAYVPYYDLKFVLLSPLLPW